MLKIVWSYSNYPLSKLIKWFTKEPVSHVAVVFMDNIVIHSNLLGCHMNSFTSFKKHSKIVFEHEIFMSDKAMKPIMLQMIDS